MRARFHLTCLVLLAALALPRAVCAEDSADAFRDLRQRLDREATQEALGQRHDRAREEGARRGGQDEEGWIPFESKEGGFEVLMPGVPRYKHAVKETRVGEVEENLFELSADEGDFAVEYTDLPGIAVLLGGTKAILRRVKSELLKNEEGRELQYFRKKLYGEKGAELVYRTKDALGGARFFLVDKRLFVIVATVDEAQGDKRLIGKFLDSFSFLKQTYPRKPHKYIELLRDSLVD